MQADHVRLGLGVITHRRPDGLMRLLKSFAQLKVPEGVECTVVIAENDDVPMAAAQVETVRTLVPFDLQMTLEPERGIPFARNRVLDMAHEGKFDFLTFVDDDQIVHQDWLTMLYATIEGRALELVGGPWSVIAEPNAALSKQNKFVLRYYLDRSVELQTSKALHTCTPKEAKVHIYTHNWIVRLSSQKRLGIRFDETYRFTGGSDTKFYADVAAAGGLTGWSSDARVTEIWPAKRLTFSYLYRRRRDQTTMNYVRAGHRPKLKTVLLMSNRCMIFGFFKIVRAVFDDYKSFAEVVHSVAELSGVIRARRGLSSTLYARSDEVNDDPVQDFLRQ